MIAYQVSEAVSNLNQQTLNLQQVTALGLFIQACVKPEPQLSHAARRELELALKPGALALQLSR